MSTRSYGGWRPYVSAAKRRRQAAKKIAKMKKSGREISPIEIAGRKITTTFWGQAWCQNLESYSDYSNRLPRGRTYVRNGSVIDLHIEKGRVRSLVSGSDLYEVDIEISRLAKKHWTDIKGGCAGKIDSLVELLQGSISKGVMEVVTRRQLGLFPAPREISLGCSCPDWAIMCKHVAATLYGVGARLDHEPELLFTLRGVDPAEMVEAAVSRPPADGGAQKGRRLAADELSSIFGVDIDTGVTSAEDTAAPATRSRRTAQTKKKTTTKIAKKKIAKKKIAKKKIAKKKIAKKKIAKKKATKTKAKAKNPTAKKKATTKKATTKKATTKKATTKKATTKKAAPRPGRSPSRA